MESIFTPAAPKPIGPYAQAVRAGDWLFVSGQIPLDPATGKLVAGSVREQAAQALSNLRAVLGAARAGLENVVKATVYLQDIKDFPEVNRVYAEFFQEPFPARAVMQAAALPAGALVEIEAVAYIPRSGM